ncbi:hypothetical protein J6590_080619 [Homalodisca vitripennis]|nr:hypothetical protein J6590_080619 [Homalodisca vitripennis]
MLNTVVRDRGIPSVKLWQNLTSWPRAELYFLAKSRTLLPGQEQNLTSWPRAELTSWPRAELLGFWGTSWPRAEPYFLAKSRTLLPGQEHTLFQQILCAKLWFILLLG